ncbi:hypothetical protein O181_009579 [Austropuccinia psidii MF-1]|uniref:Uncharacterized protein n=1 Tax=Austropuccinia psidii MF-1 TaxID=1389203 RepID=A0A9Q3BR19_9BASI|nr:hypothetical protein [Austropuccinia psidii MF-1]
MQSRLLEERETMIRENQATIKAIEEQLSQTGPILILSGSQGVDQPKPQWLQTIQAPEYKWPRVTSLHNPRKFPGEDKDIRAKTRHLWPNSERVRPNDPEAVGLGERSTQEPEIVVNTSRISSPNNRNITPPQNEHNVVTPEIDSNSDALWLRMP